MIDNIILLITLSLVVIFSPFFARLFRVPTTPVEIILGAVLGYAGLLHTDHLFEFVAEAGFLYLMFIAGTEIDLKKVLKAEMKLIRRILLYIGLLYLFAITISLYFDLGKVTMVLLPLISIGLVATLSKEYGKTPWLELSMTAGGIGEVISIGVLTLASATFTFGIGEELFKTIGALVLFIVIIYLLFRALQIFFWWYPEVLTALMPHDDKQEQDIRLSMGILLILIGAMFYLELELAFGAFIAGIFIPTFFEHKQELPEKLSSFGFGFIIPIFFIYIGTTFNLGALGMDKLIITALIITFGMITMRVISSLVFIKFLGIRNSILMGLSHSMPLTLLIAVTTLAYHAHSIDKLHYYAFILASLFEVIIVMILIRMISEYFPDKSEQAIKK
ncbi:MAG: cation:proton antiporter [Epsilonproteobacteria bacterium]|nr:MAG: cation:proton antiporter [Campylobacterota bacterium]